MADSIEKVFFGWWTKFSSTAGAFCARRCEGPHRFTQKRPPTFVSSLQRDAELFSKIPSSGRCCQRNWFSHRRNREGSSTRKSRVRVFTQPRPNSDMGVLVLILLLTV